MTTQESQSGLGVLVFVGLVDFLLFFPTDEHKHSNIKKK